MALMRLSESVIALGSADLTISSITTGNRRGEHGNVRVIAANDGARAERTKTRIKKTITRGNPKEPRQWPLLL
ncbi:MAG TPA: hypothetical protein VNR39_21465 [Pseudolabrys sp.]|nr:hypothetical protein [Pseudolabrys sp.]